MLADIVGYYADHNHDDRYLPKSSIVMGHPAFTASGTNTVTFINGCIQSGMGSQVLEAPIELPVGVTITGFNVWVVDVDATNSTTTLFKTTTLVTDEAHVTSAGVSGIGMVTATLATPEVVDSGEFFFMRFAPGTAVTNLDICGIEILLA